MIRKVCSAAILMLGVLIALGSLGHGIGGARVVHAELSKFPIATDVYTMLFVVWYFVSGCMFVFGAAVVWSWFRLRRGDTGALLVSEVVGALYAAVGIGGMIYRNGDPFMGMFLLEGALLLVASLILGAPAQAPIAESRYAS